jgi:two-component system chemotaxis response regulator CheY
MNDALPQTPAAGTGSQPRVLIVEDDALLRKVFHTILEKSGFTITLAVDGMEGLEQLLSGGYDLILMDVMMPKMDGFHVLEEYHKRTSKQKNGPILIMTTLVEDAVLQKVHMYGAAGYIEKSALKPEQLPLIIRSYLPIGSAHL